MTAKRHIEIIEFIHILAVHIHELFSFRIYLINIMYTWNKIHLNHHI